MPNLKDDHDWLAGAKAHEAKNAAAIERLTKEISKLTLQRVKLDNENRALSWANAQEAKNAAVIERLTKEISKLTLQRVKLDNENRALSLSILACEEHLKKQEQQ
jgi:DNA-binding transcriptional regulator YdaS (Cro superfamily)